jgi:hypothetical protein
MKYRQLGRTGLKVSEIGFGAWGIGKSEWGSEDAASLETLKAARAARVNVGFSFNVSEVESDLCPRAKLDKSFGVSLALCCCICAP